MSRPLRHGRTTLASKGRTETSPRRLRCLSSQNRGLGEWANRAPLLDVATNFTIELEVQARPGRLDSASQTPTHQLSKLAILRCTYNLAAVSSNRREHLNEVECPEVIHMLDGIIKDKCAPPTPRPRQAHCKQKC